MDIDTVVIDANFTLPFEEFAAKSKDLVVYGNRTETEKGHPVKGVQYLPPPVRVSLVPQTCLLIRDFSNAVQIDEPLTEFKRMTWASEDYHLWLLSIYLLMRLTAA